MVYNGTSNKQVSKDVYVRSCRSICTFAALTGHKEAVLEQQRITQTKRILSNEEKLEINEKIVEMVKLKSKCRITYFEKDQKKSGGKYHTATYTFKRLDELNKTLIFKENVQIQIDDIVDIELLGQ